MMNFTRALFFALIIGSGILSCGYSYYTGPLQPGQDQASSISVADDGTLTFAQDRFEVRLKPMTDEELNRQFFQQFPSGVLSLQTPIPFGNTIFWGTDEEKQRFTVLPSWH